MSTFYVKKDGSGTHQTIQSAFVSAVSGDTIEVDAGLWEENVDFYKDGITLKGMGKTQTEVRGVLESNLQKTATYTLGSTTLNIEAGTAGLLVGRVVTGTGIPVGARIVSISDTAVVISSPTTAAKTSQSISMIAVPSAIVVRGSNHVIKDMKITAVQALESRTTSDNAAIFFRNTGNGATPALNYLLENCDIEARGESAIMTDSAAGIGLGIIRNNKIYGKTFVGAAAGQVPAFGTFTRTGTVLSTRTIQFDNLSGITAPHAGNSQGSEISPGLRVVSISGNVVTVSANITDPVGTARSFSFANVQFNYPNVPRQLVVVQGVNQATQFLNNLVEGATGSGVAYNTAVTVDTANAVITGNTLKGEFKFGFALRARGAGATVSNNVNYGIPPKQNAGYLIGPTGSQVFGLNIGTNTTIEQGMVSAVQAVAGQPVAIEMSKELVKSISKVAADPVFSDEANWRLVAFIFKKQGSSKRLVGAFRSFDGEKSMKLRSGMLTGDVFELHKIIISKADRTLMVVKRAEIDDASSYDFTLA
jgi:hypothetical protein